MVDHAARAPGALAVVGPAPGPLDVGPDAGRLASGPAVSLLDNGTEIVQVFPQVSRVDDEGNEVLGPATESVAVRAHVQPISSSEDTALGQAAVPLYWVVARSAPAGPWAHVEWRGARWEVLGEPAAWHGPAHLAHVTATVRRWV